MTLDITKPVQTRDGRAVTLDYRRTDSTEYPLIGRILEGDESQAGPQAWTEEGHIFVGVAEHCLDLVNVPETTVNVPETTAVAECNAAAADGAWRFFRDETAQKIVASASRDWTRLTVTVLPTDDEKICRRAIERANELVRQLRAA